MYFIRKLIHDQVIEVLFFPTKYQVAWSNLLMQKKNITKRFTREFITINHQQMTLHPLEIEIMDQSSVNPWINVAIKIDENMICGITLFWEHLTTVRLPNYNCILKKHTKKHTFT
jgi:hypothetical protein